MFKIKPSKPVLFKFAFKRLYALKAIAVVTLISVLFTSLYLCYGGTSTAYAASDNTSTINFQARLMNASGSIVPDGCYNVQFQLFNVATGGTALWTESYTYASTNSGISGTCYSTNGTDMLNVVNGYLTVPLGSLTAFSTAPSINWNQPLYLTINIGGTSTTSVSYDGAMSPSLPLTGVPYAFTAGELAQYNGTYTSTLQLAAPTSGNQTFTIPDQGAAGSYDLLTTTAANADYIQNTSTLQSGTANFNISGTGIANTSLLTPDVDALTAGGTLYLGSGNAASGAIYVGYGMGTGSIYIGGGGQTGTITMGRSTATNTIDIGTVAGDGYTQTIKIGTSTTSGSTTDVTIGSTIGGATTLQGEGMTNALTYSTTTNTPSDVIKTTTNSTTAFEVEGSTTVLDVDTTHDRVGIGTAAPAYPLDVVGDINTSTTYSIAGATVLQEVGTNNILVGGAGNNTIGGTGNVGISAGALNDDTSGSFNFALGGNALFANTTGSGNVAIGIGALQDNVGGIDNIGIGQDAGLDMASNNLGDTLIGYGAASNLTGGGTAGGYDTIIGLSDLSDTGITSGGDDIIIGADDFASSAPAAYVSGDIIIGNNINTTATSTGTNYLNIGNVLYGNTSNGTGYLESNSTTAFQVQSSSATVLDVDTTDQSVGISVGTDPAPTDALDVGGGIDQTGFSTTQTTSTAGLWAELGSCTLTMQSQQCLTTINLVGNGGENDITDSVQATINVRVRQQETMGTTGAGDPYINLALDGTAESLTTSDFRAIPTTYSSGQTVVKLYVELPDFYMSMGYTPVINSGSIPWVWTPNTTLLSTLPSAAAGSDGAITPVYGDNYANTMTIQNSSDSPDELQVTNAEGGNMLNVDSSANSVTILQNAQYSASGGQYSFTLADSLTSPNQAVRWRVNSNGANLESGGTDMYLSGWANANFTGAQDFFLRGSLSTGYLYVGDAFGTGDDETGTAGPTALVLDQGTNSDPPVAGEANGGMYYNTSTDSFMCGQDGSWSDCTGLVMSTTSPSENRNNTTETDIGQYWTAPQNDCQPGVVYDIRASGVATSPDAAYDLTFYLRDYNSVSGTNNDLASATVENGTGSSWTADMATMTCYSTTEVVVSGNLWDEYSPSGQVGSNFSTFNYTGETSYENILNGADGDRYGSGIKWSTGPGTGYGVYETQFTVQRLGAP